MGINRFRLLRRGFLAGGIISSFDTGVGNGVDATGFANLPLRAGGTVGTDAVSGAPTTPGTITYTAGSRTLASTAGTGGTVATWTGILTIGQTYVAEIAYDINDCGLIIKDESGATQVTLFPNIGGFPAKGLAYVSFTATGNNVIIAPINDVFSGTLQIGKIAPLTGALPAKQFFVNPGSGDDTRSGVAAQSSTTPMNSVTEAFKFVTSGNGDQILVAEGTTFTALPNTMAKSGFSAVYPFTIQTYDPADPSNTAKYGRAYQRSAWVIVTDPTNSSVFGPGVMTYFALRGFQFDPGNIPDQSYQITSRIGDTPPDFILIEGCRFLHCGLAYNGDNGAGAQAQCVIVRNCVNSGSFTETSGARPSNVFFDFVKFSYEYNINWHAGWKIGANRDDDITIGGLIDAGTPVGDFRHPVYQTSHSDQRFVRGNFIADGAGDSGTWRGDMNYTGNFIMDCPIAFYFEGGDSYVTKRPSGRMITAHGNAALGSVPSSTGKALGWGIVTMNGQSGSEVYDNLCARGNPSSADATSISNSAPQANPSYVNLHGNIFYLWTNSGAAYFIQSDANAPLVHTTYGTNYTDDPTGSPSGTNNVNVSTLTFPNAYTETSLLSEFGYANKQALIDDLIANPVAHKQLPILSALRTGYGLS